MTEVFGATYSRAYDALYGDKNYVQECDLIQRFFENHRGDERIDDVLDLGCGTGGHALVLAERGWRVVGVDRSEEMLTQARTKALGAGLAAPPEWVCGDIRDIHLGKTFDAAIMMFAVLGYQLRNEDVLATLTTMRRHLRAGGLAVLDFWYGPGVLHERPARRTKEVPTAEGRWRRVASSDLDVRRHRCTVHYELEHVCGSGVRERAAESHDMRFFFPLELQLLLQLGDLTLVELAAFPETDKRPDQTCWNAIAVARAGGDVAPGTRTAEDLVPPDSTRRTIE